MYHRLDRIIVVSSEFNQRQLVVSNWPLEELCRSTQFIFLLALNGLLQFATVKDPGYAAEDYKQFSWSVGFAFCVK